MYLYSYMVLCNIVIITDGKSHRHHLPCRVLRLLGENLIVGGLESSLLLHLDVDGNDWHHDSGNYGNNWHRDYGINWHCLAMIDTQVHDNLLGHDQLTSR